MDTKLQELRRQAHATGDYTALERELARTRIALIRQYRGVISCKEGVITSLWRDDPSILWLPSVTLTCNMNLFQPTRDIYGPTASWQLKPDERVPLKEGDMLMHIDNRNYSMPKQAIARLIRLETRCFEVSQEYLWKESDESH